MKISTKVSLAAIGGASLALCACSGGSNDDSNHGWVTVALTDSPSTEVDSFVVEVSALTLTRANGDVITVLSSPAQVDLAKLSDASQLLNEVKVHKGDFTQAQITLDFTNASASIVDQTAPATLVTTTGSSLTGQMTLPIQFDKNFHVDGDRHRVLEFDFGLDQSLNVDTTTNTVMVEPSIGLRVDPGQPKSLVAFGLLKEVTRSNDTFTVQLQTLAGVSLETLLFESRSGTVYQIDGHPYLGPSGADALDALPVDTWVQVYADNEGHTSHYHASCVEAGVGSYNGGQDLIDGWVTDRSSGAGTDALLTVVGSSSNAAHTSSLLNTTFTVATTFANTKVNRFSHESTHSLDDVNVGQKVRVFGSLVGTNLDASTNSGVIRMYPTTVFGLAAGGPSSGVLTIDLSRVDLRDQNVFTWANSGTTPPTPTAFTLDVGSLADNLNIIAGTGVQSRGFFAPVNDAASDFNAKDVVNADSAPVLLVVEDRLNGMTVNTTATAASIVMDISGVIGTDERTFIDQGFLGVIALPTSPSPTIAPKDATTPCVLRDLDLGTVNVYTSFSTFSNALALKLTASGMLAHFGAVGTYDAVTNTLSAQSISVVID